VHNLQKDVALSALTNLKSFNA